MEASVPTVPLLEEQDLLGREQEKDTDKWISGLALGNGCGLRATVFWRNVSGLFMRSAQLGVRREGIVFLDIGMQSNGIHCLRRCVSQEDTGSLLCCLNKRSAPVHVSVNVCDRVIGKCNTSEVIIRNETIAQ